jgi:hypothetical protein
MFQIVRVQDPTLEEYRAASRVCEEYYGYLKPLNRDDRFEVFRRLGVELVLVRGGAKTHGVCFVLPDRFSEPEGDVGFVWLFQLFCRQDAKSAGALMLYRIMNWYPAIMCIGVSDEGGKVYESLGWGRYDRVWRCFHPIGLSRMVDQYRNRLEAGWRTAVYRAVDRVYEPCMRVLESFLSAGVEGGGVAPDPSRIREVQRPLPIEPCSRLGVVSNYLKTVRVGCDGGALRGVEIGGIGRVVQDESRGLARLRVHAKLWQALRRDGAVAGECLAASRRARRRALLTGYLPVRMPIYYWDRQNRFTGFFQALETSGFGFASCDKIF